MPTDAILHHVQSLGYIVKEFRVNGVIEFHAIPLKADMLPQIGRCNDGDDEACAYRAACLLACTGSWH